MVNTAHSRMGYNPGNRVSQPNSPYVANEFRLGLNQTVVHTGEELLDNIEGHKDYMRAKGELDDVIKDLDGKLNKVLAK